MASHSVNSDGSYILRHGGRRYAVIFWLRVARMMHDLSRVGLSMVLEGDFVLDRLSEVD